jgi:hypothetical protein
MVRYPTISSAALRGSQSAAGYASGAIGAGASLVVLAR